MRISRTAAGTLFVTGALTLTLTALVYPSMLGVQAVSSAPSRVIANTSSGPLTEADRDFVVKVRAAGLWEFPSGELAMKKGTIPAVRTAGAHLVNGHVNLDAVDRKVAAELGITLPNQPSPQQQGFVTTLTNDTGKQFDNDLANILRLTHGQIFPAIANIRATTKNTLVRQLADVANDTVLDHITVMEQTGLVNFDSLVFQETTPPKLPKSSLTPPAPQPGEPTVVLSPPPGFTPPPSTTPGAAAAPGSAPTTG
jgi:predicted outer membrane protein